MTDLDFRGWMAAITLGILGVVQFVRLGYRIGKMEERLDGVDKNVVYIRDKFDRHIEQES